MPIAGGARFQDGWLDGRAAALRSSSEIKEQPKLVDALFGASADAGSIPAASILSPEHRFAGVTRPCGPGHLALALLLRGLRGGS
jgi:hypothetical protein